MREWNILDYGNAENIGEAVNTVLTKIAETNEPSRLIFPKGVYHFYKETAKMKIYHTSNTDSRRYPEKSVAILLEKVCDLEIDGCDSLFLFHGNIAAIAAFDCERITIKNLSWDYPCADTIEMNTVSVNKNTAVFSIPKGQQWKISGRDIIWFEKSPLTGENYRQRKNTNGCWGVLHLNNEKRTLVRAGLFDSPFTLNRISVKKLSDTTVEFKYLGKPSSAVTEGRTFVICPNKNRIGAGVFYSGCSDMVAENIHAMYIPHFSWLVQMCHNVTFRSCKFVPADDADRFITSFADSVHVAGASGYVHIEDCLFSHDQDDPINIHGSFMRVEKVIDKHTLRLIYCQNQQGGFAQFREGDKVEFYSRDTLESVNSEQLFTVKSSTHPLSDGNNFVTSIVTFCEELPECLSEKLGSEGKYVAENVTFTPDVVIRNCHFAVVPTRGILCTTRGKVLIENNTFDAMTMATIYISNDSNNWYESGPVRDVTIRGNTFYIKKSPQDEHDNKGGIFVDPITKGGKLPDWRKPIHRNITVENNTFYMEHDNVVKARSVENLTVRNNTVKLLDTPEADETIKAYSFTACKNVVIEGNTYDKEIDTVPETYDMPTEQVKYNQE